MEDFLTQYRFIIVPLLTWFFLQLFKVIHEFATTKQLDWKRLYGAGGMPSSHSATVMALAIMIGKENGFNSPIFALALLFALVVMYDAMGVRRAVGKQAKMLNKIIEEHELSGGECQPKFAEALGHRPKEVLIGGIIGIIVGVVA